MISGASLQIWSVSVGQKLVVEVLHQQGGSELGLLCFDSRWCLQLRVGKSDVLCFRQEIWQLPKTAISTL